MGLSKSTGRKPLDRFETYTLLDRIMDDFKAINKKKGLTEEDRKQIKKLYLDSFITRPKPASSFKNTSPNISPRRSQPVPTQNNLLQDTTQCVL